MKYYNVDLVEEDGKDKYWKSLTPLGTIFIKRETVKGCPYMMVDLLCDGCPEESVWSETRKGDVFKKDLGDRQTLVIIYRPGERSILLKIGVLECVPCICSHPTCPMPHATAEQMGLSYLGVVSKNDCEFGRIKRYG